MVSIVKERLAIHSHQENSLIGVICPSGRLKVNSNTRRFSIARDSLEVNSLIFCKQLLWRPFHLRTGTSALSDFSNQRGPLHTRESAKRGIVRPAQALRALQ